MLRHLVCFILICMSIHAPIPMLAKGPVEDSLRQHINQLPDGKGKFEAIIDLTQILQRTDTDEALEFAGQAIKLASRLKDDLILVQAYNALGTVYRNRGENLEAARHHQKALEKLRGTNHYQAFANTYRYIALTHYYKGELPDALLQAERALSISRTYDYTLLKAQISNLMGAIYRRQGDFGKALELYFEARQIYEELGNQRGVAQTINNMANIYLEQNQVDQALENYLEVVEIYMDMDEQVGLATAYNNIGLVHFRKENFERAFLNYSKSLTIYEKTGRKREQVFALNKMAELAAERGRPKEALSYLEQAERVNLIVKDKIQEGLSMIFTGKAYLELNDVSKGVDYLRKGLERVHALGAAAYTIDAYRTLADAFVQIGDFEQAYSYQSALIAYRDSLNGVGVTELEENVRSARLVKEKEKKISALEHSQITEYYTRMGLISLLIGIVLLVGLGFLYFRYRYKSRYASLLSQKNQEIAEQNRRLENYNSDLEQFAFVVSHNLKEPLRTIGNYTSLVEKKFSGRISKEESSFFNLIKQGVNHMHALLSNLLIYVGLGKEEIRPVRLDMNQVLKQVMGKLSAEIEESGAQIILQPMPHIFADQAGMELLFYHLLNNALKFRSDVPLKIYLVYSPSGGYHQFSITDNGIGFKDDYKGKIFEVFQRLHTQEAYPGTGIGLAICRKVVQQHKGWISVSSEPDKGSTFQIHLPITG